MNKYFVSKIVESSDGLEKVIDVFDSYSETIAFYKCNELNESDKNNKYVVNEKYE